jgi:uncharacterized protein YuzE
MKRIDLGVSIQVNKETGDVSAVYFRIRQGRAARVRELAEGNAFANYDSQGRLIGIELLGPCEVTVLDRIARREPQPVKNFLRKTIPREMAIA